MTLYIINTIKEQALLQQILPSVRSRMGQLQQKRPILKVCTCSGEMLPIPMTAC